MLRRSAARVPGERVTTSRAVSPPRPRSGALVDERQRERRHRRAPARPASLRPAPLSRARPGGARDRDRAPATPRSRGSIAVAADDRVAGAGHPERIQPGEHEQRGVGGAGAHQHGRGARGDQRPGQRGLHPIVRVPEMSRAQDAPGAVLELKHGEPRAPHGAACEIEQPAPGGGRRPPSAEPLHLPVARCGARGSPCFSCRTAPGAS